MEYTEEFNDLRKAMIIKHLRYKREFIKDENELNLIDLKIKELENKPKSNQIQEKTESKFLDKIDNDFKKYALYKTWNRLNKEQKMSQMKIYLDNMIQAINIDKIREIILQYLDCGLLTNKYIVYDSKIAKITNIKCLKYDNNSDKYILDIKKSKKVKSV